MIIILKNKESLIFDDFTFRCTIGRKGLTKNKIEGDKKTPIGKFALGPLYYRNDRNPRPITKLKCISITKNMGWCHDVKNKKYYNKLIKIKNKIKYIHFLNYQFEHLLDKEDLLSAGVGYSYFLNYPT